MHRRRSTPRIDRRLGHALRQSVGRLADRRRMAKAGCERILCRAALSAICGGDERPRSCDAAFAALDGHALAAGAARRAALLRRSGLYRSVASLDRATELAQAVVQPDVILASFHGIPQAYVDKGDPYPAHCHETARLLRDGLGMRREATDADLPVALRPGRMAAALYRQDGGGAGAERREESCRSSRRASPPIASKRWRRSRSRTPISSSTNGGENFAAIPCLNDSEAGHAGDPRGRFAGIEGLGRTPNPLLTISLLTPLTISAGREAGCAVCRPPVRGGGWVRS